MALTHVLSSATELMIARKRVRFSGLYACWLLIAMLGVLVNWVSLWGLVALRRWTMAEVTLQFLVAVIQYFTCSTFRISEVRDGEPIDLPELFQQRRPLIFGAFLALTVVAAFQNWWDRNNMAASSPNEWIGEDLTIVPMSVAVLLAGWARPGWLQWAGAVSMFGLVIYFLMSYAIPVS